MNKLNKLFAILFAVLGVTTLKAQNWTDKTSLLANPSFENETTATNLGSGKNGWGGPTGWILSPSNAPANSQSGAIASSCNIQGIATTFPTADGGNYFYVRTNWNNDPTFALSQVISGDLPAGLYRLTCMAASNSGNWSTSTFKLTLKESDGNISTNSSLNKCSEWTEWTVDLYKTDPSTSLTIEAAMRAGSSGGGQHYQMLLDDFKLEYMSFDDIEAAGWPKPQVPGSNLKSFVGTSVVAAMYNVGSDAFVTRGMTWSTQAIATKLHNSDTQAQGATDRHHVKVSAGDGDLVKFIVNGKQYLGDGGQGSTTAVYTDNGNTEINQFIYSELNEGTYRLKVKNATSDENAFLDVSQPYGGQLTYANGQGFTEWAIIKFSDIENGKYASYKAKKAMYEVYKAVVDAGHSATYSDALRTALATYIKPNATASDVTAATNVLIKAVAPALTAGYVNVGALFTNPDMRGAGDKSAWTSGYTGVSWGCLENWHGNKGSNQLTQTQTQLPNGFYKIVYHGIWRQDGSDAGPVLTLSSNGKSASANVPCMTDVAWGVGNIGNSSNKDWNDWTEANGRIIPNGMKSAGEALSHGGAQATVSDFVVSNGELTIDVNTSSGTQWLLAQGFDIYYKAESMEEYANLFNTAKAAANAIDASTLNTYAANILSNALSNAATEQINKEWYQARTKELNDAVALANDIAAPYGKASALLATCEDILKDSEEFVADAKTTFTTAVATAKTNVANAQTSAVINEEYGKLEAARQEYVQKADPKNGVLFDYTFLLKNPSFETGTTEGWTTSSGGDTGAKLNSNGTYTINGADGEFVFNTWGTSDMRVEQTLQGIPTGLYTAKAIVASDANNVITLTAGGTTKDVTITTDKSTATEGVVETSYSSGDFLIKAASTTWFKADHFRLYFRGFDVPTAQLGVTNLKAEAEALVGKPMNAAVAADLDAAIEGADATKTTRNELNSMIEALSKAIAEAEASIAEYAAIKTYIDKANKIEASIAASYKSQYENGSITETATKVFQALEVATYKYVTENFNYAVPISSTWNSTGTNTSAKEFNNEHWSGETRGYMNQNDDNGQGWNASAWSLDFDQDVTLPAGEYVFKVAGRKSADATLELVVTMGETILGTVSDFPNGSVGLGINKAGEASFDPNDQFARGDNTGCGWQWRYVKFTLDNEATVKIAVHAETNVLHNWVSFGDYTLQMTEKTYLEANKGGLVAPTAAAEALVDTKPMGTAENDALTDALALPVTTGAELKAKITALETAVAKANAWVVAYNEAKTPLVAALERFEADYNKDGVKMSKNTWNNVLDMVKDAADAKDVTDSYAGFQTAADNLNAALDAAQTSINMYANFAAEISYAKAYTPIVEGNVDAHNAAITAAEIAYNAAEIDDASELIRAMQNFRVIDYEYVSNYYNLDQPVELNGEWTGDKNTTNGQHWKGDNTSYYDYNQSNEEPYEATITVTLQPGEYVLMAAGRAQTTGSSAYIKVNDKLAYFAAKGNTGYGIDTDGKANFSSEATYANDNKGRGWEYRFIEFTLTEETEVTLVAGMQIGSNSWASVCTPVLYTTPLDAAKNDLQTAIKNAENALSAYPVGDEAFQISKNSDAYKVFSQAIVTAKGYLGESNIGVLEDATETLNAAVETFETSYVLNNPSEGQRFYIKVAKEGHAKKGNAVIATLGETSKNNPTGYTLSANNKAKGYLKSESFIFTQVEGNLYNISVERPEGTVYLTYGNLNESAAGWNQQQIQATSDPEKKGNFKIVATSKSGVFKIYNTENNNYIDCQSGGAIYTDTNIENEEFAFELAIHKVSLTISSAGWATLILPFNAELPKDVVAYESDGVKDGAVQLVEATSLVANTPYLIKGTKGDYDFSGYGLATEDSYTKNLFVGTYVEIKAEVGSYVLQNPKDDEGNPRGLGFYLVGEGQPTVKAYRSYMKYTPAEGQAASPMFRIGGSTGIDNATLPNSNEVVIYDLMGRKVTTMEKGNMYIINGRKVIVK